MSQKVSRHVVNDIASGASNTEVCEKHGLGNAQVETIRRKLKAAGVVKDNGSGARSNGNTTQITTQSLWKCPACNTPQLRGYRECPQCGVLVEKYYRIENEKKEKRQDALRSKRDKIKRRLASGADRKRLADEYCLTNEDIDTLIKENQQHEKEQQNLKKQRARGQNNKTTQTMFCPHCGEQIPADAVVCAKGCGRPVTPLVGARPRDDSVPWTGGDMVALVILTLLLPLIGFIFGIWGLTQDAKRSQGGALLAIALVGCFFGLLLIGAGF